MTVAMIAATTGNEEDDPDIRWRLPDGVGLTWKSWSDEAVVFNALSGQTHLLDAFSAALLGEIEAEPLTAHELGARLSEKLGLPADAAIAGRIAKTCVLFDDLGLAEPGTP